MAVIRVNEIHEGRQSQAQDTGDRTYSRSFYVWTNSKNDGPLVVRLAPGIPRIGEPYVERNGLVDLAVYCKSVTADQDSSSFYKWKVKCDYSSRSPGGHDPSENDPNPLLRPCKVKFSSRAKKKALEFAALVEFDAEGNETVTEDAPVQNTANEPFDPPPEDEVFVGTLVFTRNEPFFDEALLFGSGYLRAVNEDQFRSFAPGTCCLANVEATDAWDKAIGKYYEVAYTVEVDPEGFDLKLLDAGYRDRDGNDLVSRKTGAHRSGPSMLNGLGYELGEGEDPVKLTYRSRKKKPFAALNLPQT